MAMTRLSWMLAVLFVVDLNFAFGDIAPRPGFVEQCTLARQQKAGQECRACRSSFQGRKDCEQLGEQGYSHNCSGSGASVRTEVWCRPAPKADLSRTSVLLRDHGSIASVSVPGDWTWRRGADGPDSYLIVYPPRRQDVFVLFSAQGDRREPLNDALAQPFQSLLKKPVGLVKKTDLDPVTPLLARSAQVDPQEYRARFRLKEARTETHEKFTALFVEGDWSNNPRHTLSWYFDASACGKIAQRIELTAPSAALENYRSVVKKLVDSIVWQPVVTDVCR